VADSRGNDSRESRDRRVGDLARAYGSALLTGDEVAADVAIRQAIDAGLSAAEIDDDVIAPALWLVGELWQRGEISVADEHIATEISLRVLALQHEARRVRRVRPGHRVMLATPPGELHVVALRMLANLLREGGYDAVMVGADVPGAALAAAANRHDASVICLSTTMPGGADRLLVAIHDIQQRCPGVGFVIGGRGVTSRVPMRPGIEVCRRVTDGVPAVDAIVNRASLN
jgi:MerR family transcriptional regulator, light-induced transcriptional regulator